MDITSEGPVKITKTAIEAVWRRRKPNQRLVVRDKDCGGLALIVNPRGMAWSYSYRPRGSDSITGKRFPNRTVTIGNPESHSPDDARAEANRLKGQIVAGGDPVHEKKQKQAAELRKRATTLTHLMTEYAEALPHRPKMRGNGLPSASYVAEELAQVGFALTAMDAENKPAADLAEPDIRKLLNARGGGETVARKRFGALSRFLDWCQDAGHVGANPCLLIARSRRPKAPSARSHYLTPEELARLWKAAGELQESVWRDYARFLMAVPCRRGEAARLDWSHLDLGAGEWRQPAHMTKNRDPHRLHLHPLAIDLLRDRRKESNGKGLVFPAPESGKALDSFTRLKNRISKGADLADWTWHDFRRSFATALGEAGIPETVADAILNHRQSATRGGVLGVYQRASRWPEQIRAMEHWGRLLAGAIDGREANAVVVAMVPRAG